MLFNLKRCGLMGLAIGPWLVNDSEQIKRLIEDIIVE